MAKSTEFVGHVRQVIPLAGLPKRYHTILEWDWGVLVTGLAYELSAGQPVVITVAEFKEPDRCAE